MPRHPILVRLLCISLAFAGCSQPVFVEESDGLPPDTPSEENRPSVPTDDTHTYDPLSWDGETEKFRIEDDGLIRLYDTSDQAGTACLATPLTTPDRTCWQLHVRLSFNPSANNHLRIYLMADSPDLTGNVDGYYLQVGGKEDRIYFYRQQGDALTLLCQTEAFMRGDSSPEVHIQVERDSQGYFQLYVPETDAPAQPLAIIKDTAVSTASHCGIVCTYTASNSRKMRVPVFRIHHDVHDVEELESGQFQPSTPSD